MTLRCVGCDFTTDLVYDAAAHSYAMGVGHGTVAVRPNAGYEGHSFITVDRDDREAGIASALTGNSEDYSYLDDLDDEPEDPSHSEVPDA